MSYTEIPKEELKIFEILSNKFERVFDVGCRDDLDYYNIEPNIEYHLFEPNKKAIESIKNKISELDRHKIILNEFGLSDVNEDNCVYYSNIESFVPHWCVPSVKSKDQYSLKKLDDYITNNKIDKIDMIKIDVEGLDYNVVLGGINTLKTDNKVSYIQLEYSGNIAQYVKLLDNFNFYLMIEPRLLSAINELNKTKIDFNQSLIKLNDDIIEFIDHVISPTGNGGNIFGINKSIKDIDSKLFFKIYDNDKLDR